MSQYFPNAISSSRGANIAGPSYAVRPMMANDNLLTGSGRADMMRAAGVGLSTGALELFMGNTFGDVGMMSRAATSAGAEIAADLLQGYLPPVGPKGIFGQAAGPVMSGISYAFITGWLGNDPRTFGMKALQQGGVSAVYEVVFGRGMPSQL